MAQTHASKALQKIEVHEAECALRYESINARLDAGSKRFDKLERMIWGIYPLMVTSLLGIMAAVWLKWWIMFGFGVGEAATIAAVLQGLKSLNDGLATVKEAGANAGQISSLVSRYSDLDQKIRDVEAKKAGVLSVKDSMNLQVAKQQAANFHQALKDSLLMQQGGAAQYREIMQRIEESKVAHEKEVNRLKIKRRQRQKLMKEVGQYAFIGILCVVFLIGALYIWVNVFR